MSSENVLVVDTEASKPTSGEQNDIVEVTDLVIKYGSTTAVNGVSFRIKAGEFLTLLGPSGCGKTTTLRAIAGLETPSSGEIRVGGRVVYSSKQGINIPAEKRNLSMVFQSYAIWPHLTAFENVVYGLRVRKKSREEIKRQGNWALDLVQMGQFGERRASALSGGQQQRIALARAVAFGAEVVLFDEPLSNLDANLRAQMRNEIKDLQRKLGVTSVYVTHDQEEALTMSDRIIVMSNGRIEQEATPDRLYDYPTNRFVAHFIGSANMVSGVVDELNRDGDNVDFILEDGSRIRALDNRPEKAEGGSLMTVRAVYPQLSLVEDPEAINQWAGTIDRAIFSGDFIEYHVVVPWGTIVVRRPPTDRYEVSSSVFLKIDPSRCIVIEA